MTARTIVSREVRLASRPTSKPTLDTFDLATVAVPPVPEGQVQVRNIWMSVDPYMRGRMTRMESYVPPFQIGVVLQGGAIGRVTASRSKEFVEGDLVQSMLGWREVFNAPTGTLRKVPETDLPVEALLGVAGLPGLTALVGVEMVAKVQAGETIFVTAASGAVGSAACQIAKIRGATVVGSAGGPEKCDFLREIGDDHVIDYKAEADLKAALARAVPGGIDACFDNVGGAQLAAAIASAKPFARLALCGMISQYNDARGGNPVDIGPAVPKRLRLEGFIVSDHFDQMPSFVETMADWVRDGRVKWRQTVDDGIENAPGAFLKLFSGANLGKMLVRLAD